MVDIQPNTYIFSFDSVEDVNWVMSKCPWLFKNYLLILKQFDALTPTLKMNLTKEQFWVHMHQLLIGCMNEKMGLKIGKTIGEVIMCDMDKNGSCWDATLLVLVEMNLKKPINRGRTINVMGNKPWIPLTFEKLPRICLSCGRITHTEGTCKKYQGSSNNSTSQYCQWLKEAF